MIFLYIAFALFLYFLFMWGFRLVFILFIATMAGKAKEKAELSLKEKLNSLKREGEGE